jgi:beta-lactamase regulating signal transducer with metallopeptidase domain
VTAVADGALAHALVWALVSSVWQNVIIAAAAWCALLCLQRAGARTRYVMMCSCMAAMVALPAATGVRSYRAGADAVPGAPVPAPGGAELSPATGALRSVATPAPALRDEAAASVLRRALDPHQALQPGWLRDLLLSLWLAGVTLQLIRLVVGLRGAYRLTGDGILAPPAWLVRLTEAVARRMRVRWCVVRVSARVTMPLVIGMVRPVILVPVSFVTGLPPEAMRALLAHELAHVRRHDFLINLLQTACETLLFFHPAVWWLSRRVRQEREHCCDDVAAAVLGEREGMARALIAAEELRSDRTPACALAATDGSLSHRVRRLLVPAPSARDRGAAVIAMIPLLFALLAVPATAVPEADAIRRSERSRLPEELKSVGTADRVEAAGWEEIWSGSLPADAWLSLYNLHGPITVERGAVQDAVVLARRSGTQVHITTRTAAGDGIAICVMQPQLGACNDDGMIWRGSPAELERSVTELRVIMPLDGAVAAAAHVGSVAVRGGTAPVVVRSGAGTIEVAGNAIRIEAASGRGSIRIDGGGDVVVRSSDGDVALTDVRGDVRVRTTGGRVEAALAPGGPDRMLDISTGTGAVMVHMPEGARATLVAAAGEGSIHLGYPEDVGPRAAHARGRAQRALIGGGGRVMSITTGRGDITVTPR